MSRTEEWEIKYADEENHDRGSALSHSRHADGSGGQGHVSHVEKISKAYKGAKEIYYPGPPHGITATHQDQVNFDLLQFVQVRIRNY
jgi:hypothetical protein